MTNKDKELLSTKKKTNVLSGKEEIVHNINIGDMVLNAFKSKPDFIGQIDAATEEQITFQQMRENSVKLALWLQTRCYKSIIISICTSNQMLAYIPFLAGLYINATINPWDDSYFDDVVRLMYFLVEYEPEVMFIDASMYKQLRRAISFLNERTEVLIPPIVVTFDKIISIIEDKDVTSLESILNSDFDKIKIDQFSCKKTKPTDVAAVMYSSNATNYPGKAHLRYFAFTFPSNQEVPTMSSGDIGLWYGSLTWTYSMILIVRSIVSYVTVIKSSKRFFCDEEIYDTIEKYKVNWVFLQSNICNRLFETDIRMYNVSSLKQLVFGDSDLRRDIYEKFNEYLTDVSIIQVYSVSEACIIAAYQRNNNPIACSGYVANNIQLTILDIETKEIVGPLKKGEICCGFVCNWCNPKICTSSHCSNYRAKENNIDPESFASILSTWHCTGDLGFYGTNSKLFVIDKINHIIKYQTFCLSSREIETVLEKHPAVAEVIVSSVRHSSGEYPIAYVKKEEGMEVMREELEELVAKNLPDMYRLRGGLCFTTEMPRLPNGKIDRKLVQSW